IRFGGLQPRLQPRRGAAVDVIQLAHELVLLRRHLYLTVRTDQEGMTQPAEVNGVDDVDQGSQAQVAADHADKHATAFNRSGDGHYQIAGRVTVGLCNDRAVSSYGFGIPGAVSGVIAVRQAGLRALDKGAVSASEVGEDELRAEGRLS